jgi:hypothetical protein
MPVRSFPHLIVLVCLLALAACGNAPDPPDLIQPTQGFAFEMADVTPSSMPTIVPLPTETPLPLTATIMPTLVMPTLTPYPDDDHFSIGESVEGSPIWVWQFGDGPKTIVLVGGIHGGFEANTVVLSEMLVGHLRANPDDVLPGIRLVIIPAANPDGLLRGSDIEGRFNAHGVDLNRNWGCEWSKTATLHDMEVNPGPRPFSEPETLALRSYFLSEEPDAVLFYHSAAGGVFVGDCGGDLEADWLGELIEASTGYTFSTFDYYEVSGDAADWLAERGIPAAIIELSTHEEPEFERNLQGVMALQCHFALEIRYGHPVVEEVCR